MMGKPMWYRLNRGFKSRAGSTLPEVLTALMLSGILILGVLGMTVVTVRADIVFDKTGRADRELRHLCVYLQKQIRQSEKIYLSSRGLCLEDMESRQLGYLNYYTYDKQSRMIYRHKVTGDGQAQGTKAQFMAAVETFSLTWDQERREVRLVAGLAGEEVMSDAICFRGQVERLPW